MIREFADLEIVALPALAAARLSADREAGFTKKWLVPSIDVASEFSGLVDRKVRDAQSSLSVRYMQPTTPVAAGHFVEPPRRRQAEQLHEVLRGLHLEISNFEQGGKSELSHDAYVARRLGSRSRSRPQSSTQSSRGTARPAERQQGARRVPKADTIHTIIPMIPTFVSTSSIFKS